ncbi:hypothetical protein R6Q59_024276 [Mikania micrantha]|uniref:DUF1639 domain-containing protein n=1 Tax=Mikania micrantha TaxID=192012 RepID=A0A5N6P4N4_9ASTR|nr:hypothetical protein E3N88_14883 [Mikania micrantha]KAD5803540.1 hypothetical protein E3N88_14900 [Mikania micrantha]
MDKLQWGNRKRLRFVKVKESSSVMNAKSDGNGIVVKKKITSQRVDRRVVNEQDSHLHLPPLHASSPQRINRKTMPSSSPDKEDRCYPTRGSIGSGFEESSSSKKVLTMDAKKDSKMTVWPKLFTTLSSKEKEEDFMAMKGCKLPQRPKKRAKMIQRTLLLVSPGAWLSDLCQERYEVREKKTSKKRPRGLKAMGTMESDSE